MSHRFTAQGVLLIFFFIVFVPNLVVAQNVEDLLDKLNRLPVTERQQKLAEGARKEGELVWYSTMNRENSQELISLFEKDHPYVRVKLLNGSAVQTMTRVSSEYSARSYLFDITHIRGLFLTPLKWGERANELVELFDKLILRKGG